MKGNIYNKIREASGIPGLGMEEIESSGIMEDYIKMSGIKVNPEYIALSRFYELVGEDEIYYPLDVFKISPISLSNFISDFELKMLLQRDNSFLEHVLCWGKEIPESTINTIVDAYGKDNFITDYILSSDPNIIKALTDILNPEMINNYIPEYIRKDQEVNKVSDWLSIEPSCWIDSIKNNILGPEVLDYLMKDYSIRIDLLIWYSHEIPEDIIENWISTVDYNNESIHCYLRGQQKVSMKMLEKHWDKFEKFLDDILNGPWIELDDEFIEDKIYRPYRLGNIIKSGRPGEKFIESHWKELKRPDVIKKCISGCTLSDKFLERRWNEIKKKMWKVDIGWKTKVGTGFIDTHWKDLNTKFMTEQNYDCSVICKNQKRIEEFKKTIIESYIQ